MIDPHQHRFKDQLNGFYILKGDVAVAELILLQLVAHNPVDEVIDALHIGFFQAAGGCLDRIRKHQDSGFLRKGDRPRVAENIFVDKFLREIF